MFPCINVKRCSYTLHSRSIWNENCRLQNWIELLNWTIFVAVVKIKLMFPCINKKRCCYTSHSSSITRIYMDWCSFTNTYWHILMYVCLYALVDIIGCVMCVCVYNSNRSEYASLICCCSSVFVIASLSWPLAFGYNVSL